MLRYYSYRLPFKKPFVTALGEFTHREGIVMIYRDPEGIEAFGEAAPLPGFSKEPLTDLLPVLKEHHAELESAITSGDKKQWDAILDEIGHLPSLQFGLDTLLYDFRAKKESVPFVDLLSDKKNHAVSMNGVIGATGTKEVLLKARELTDKNIETFKLKVGINLREELSRIEKLRARYPKVKIRIDANGSWTEKQAVNYLQEFQKLDIEYCEQPVAPGEPEILKRIRDKSGIRIAADESFRNKKDAEVLIQSKAVDVLILKPMMFGRFEDAFVTIDHAKSHNIEVVFTTSLESTIGRTSTAAMAAQYGSAIYAHGLSTGSLLKEDLGKDLFTSGEFQFGNEPGLGIAVNNENLREITEIGV